MRQYFWLLFLAFVGLSSAWANTSFLYRQAFNVNYSGSDEIFNYQVMLNINTSSDYNVSLSKCNFIVTWNNYDTATEDVLPSYVSPETCNSNVWNTTVWTKLPKDRVTQNATIYVYFGNTALDSATSYSNNSGDDVFLFYDNFNLGADSQLNASKWISTPGDSTNDYSKIVNNKWKKRTYVTGFCSAAPNGCNGNWTLSNLNFTDDLIIRASVSSSYTGGYGINMFFAMSDSYFGNGTQGLNYCGGVLNCPRQSFTAQLGTFMPDPIWYNNGVNAYLNKIDNWSTYNSYGIGYPINIFENASTTKPNGADLTKSAYLTWVIADSNDSRGLLYWNQTKYIDTRWNATEINATCSGWNDTATWQDWANPYLNDSSVQCQSTNIVQSTLYETWPGAPKGVKYRNPRNINSFEQPRPVTAKTGKLSNGTIGLFDMVQGNNDMVTTIDDLTVAKYHPNMTVYTTAGIESQPAAPTATPTAVPTMQDFMDLFPPVVGASLLNIIGDTTIAGIIALLVAGLLIVFGGIGLQAAGVILFVWVYVLVNEGYLPIPVYWLFLAGGAYILFAFIMGIYRR